MSYHSSLFTNKELKRLIPDSYNWQMMWIKGIAARTKHAVKIKGKFMWVFGSDFIAKFVRR